jgi:hypothetical protein
LKLILERPRSETPNQEVTVRLSYMRLDAKIELAISQKATKDDVRKLAKHIELVLSYWPEDGVLPIEEIMELGHA